MKIELYKTRRGKFYVAIRHQNGNVLYKSSEDYHNSADALAPVYGLAASFGGTWSGLYWDHTVKGKAEETIYTPDEWREGMEKLDEEGEKESEIN